MLFPSLVAWLSFPISAIARRSLAYPDSHTKNRRVWSFSHIELVLIAPGISGGDNWPQVSYRLRVWLQYHFPEFIFNRTLVRTYLITPLTSWQCNTNSICENRLSPVFCVRIWLRETMLGGRPRNFPKYKSTMLHLATWLRTVRLKYSASLPLT